ncbi:MAG: hypothetical protein CMJ83_12795, partial [Planctomycetes bacterium]|nr:hypothetical protein [Planctomycetota bacterium]
MSPRNVALALLAFALVGVGAFVLLADEPVPDPVLPGAPPASDRDVVAESDDPPPVDNEAIDTLEFSEQYDYANEAAFEEEGLSFALIVGPRGRRIPGARVELLSLDPGRGGGFGGFGRGNSSPEVFRKVKSAGDGFALLSPLPRRRFLIVARSGGLVGVTQFTQGEMEEEFHPLPAGAAAVVQLVPLKRVHVDVVDADGAPAPHIQVSVSAANADGGRGFGGRGRGRSSSGTTHWTRTPDGKTVIELDISNDRLYEAETLDVHAQLPGRDRITETVPMPKEGAAWVTLRIPITTTVVVDLFDADDKLVKEPVNLSWWVEDPAQPDSGEGRGNRGERGRGWGGRGTSWITQSRTGSRVVTNGRVVLGGFLANSTVHFTTRSDNRISQTTTIVLNRERTQTVKVLVGDRRPYVSFSLLDPGGIPVSNVELQVRVRLDDEPAEIRSENRNLSPTDRIMAALQRRSSRSPRVTTDAAGRVTVEARPRTPGTIEINLADRSARFDFGRRGRDRGEESPPIATVRFAALDPGEKRNLGEVRLQDYAVICAGRVLDSAGEGVEGARVRVQTGESANESGRGRGRGGRGRGRGGFGRSSSGPETRTDADGNFRVFGFPQSGKEYSVVAEARDAKSQSAPFVPGAKDLLLTVREMGGIAGAVRLADPTLKARISLHLRSMSDSAESRGQSMRVGSDGEFRATRLAPGTYELEVSVNSVKDVTVTGLIVPEGKVGQPGAIQDLIVGRDFFRAVVTVRDAAGAPISRARVSFNAEPGGTRSTADNGGRGGRGRGRGGRGGTRTNDQGQADQVLKVGTVVHVTASASDYASKTVRNASFPLEIRLDKGIKVTVKLSEPMPELEGVTRGIRLSLADPEVKIPTDPTDIRSAMRTLFSGGNTESVRAGASSATFDNVTPGTYTLRALAIVGGFGRNRGGGRGQG